MAVVAIVAGYLLGSIPSAYIAGRLTTGIDIRNVGDGNVGATNAGQLLGRGTGVLVFVADASKGAAAILLATAVASQHIVLLVGVAVVAGHNWPIYIGFRGGTGQSTTIGVLCTVLPQPMGILLLASAIPYFVLRRARLAGATQFGPLWLLALLMGAPPVLVGYSIGLPCLVGARYLQTARRRRLLLVRESSAGDEGGHQGASG